jgi:predicted O-linked N-acetylglucosamine transferase (SPINDLY family)
VLERFAAKWRDVSPLGDRELAERVRNDAIDVLVDLSGHTAHNRLSTFALRPAPVQVTWLGYLNTTGLSTIDWRICDRHTDPPGETDRFYVERLFRMPASQWCYYPWHDAPACFGSRASKPDRLVFGSFNQHHRISDACLALWCRVLQRLPNAQILLLDVPHRAIAGHLYARFSHHGIAKDRIEMRERLPLSEYFAAINAVDIALDTTPYSGATTALNALWMGVPVVGLQGKHPLSRGTVSVLRTADLPELTADSTDEYVAVNVRLAEDINWRQDLRSTLRERLRKSPLMDAPAFVSALEIGYRMMWHHLCDAAREEKRR